MKRGELGWPDYYNNNNQNFVGRIIQYDKSYTNPASQMNNKITEIMQYFHKIIWQKKGRAQNSNGDGSTRFSNLQLFLPGCATLLYEKSWDFCQLDL